LEAELLAWSPGTDGPVEGDVVLIPGALPDSGLGAWVPSLRGRFLLLGPPEPMCRAPQELERWARPETVERIEQERREASTDFSRRFAAVGGRRALAALDTAGLAGLLTSRWSGGWGVNKVFNAPLPNTPAADLSCEDYGMLYRMALADQSPRIRMEATSRELGEVPQFNVIAELPGTELPDEYVILSAHLDSWHAGTGATDNGTGTIMMLEAMRILKQTYPNPRRTILVGHWGAEEMGLIGSRSFAEDHPEIMEGVQAVWNQDNGTWRIDSIEGQAFLRAGEHISRWLAAVPTEITSHIHTDFPGEQHNSGSDHSSFICRGVPAFRFQSPYPEYRQYTWHTNRDTYDKIVFDDLAENATLAAMVAYMASEDPERVPRERAQLPINPRTGEPREWPQCGTARRSY
ncbi:MAG: M20/M25/M40 family metallo-hydrolase, partial [Gemmatimonadales bacterium]